MAHLSRILLNPARARARRFFADPHILKAAILGEFAHQPVTERVLWRLGQRTTPGLTAVQGELLILTQSRPSWAGIVETAGFPDDPAGAPQVRDYGPLLALLAVGREFAFKVRVNPVQNTKALINPTKSEASRIAADASHRSLRVAHRTAGAQTLWFTARTAGWGFDVADGASGEPDLRIVDRQRLDFTKGADGGRQRVRLGTATFEGRLQITDLERFRAALLSGVGPAKGYGCGLITLAKIHDSTD